MLCNICDRRAVKTEVGVCFCGVHVSCRLCQDCRMIKIDKWLCPNHRGSQATKNALAIIHGHLYYRLYCFAGSTNDLLIALQIYAIVSEVNTTSYLVDYGEVSKEAFCESLYRLQSG
jgi:hypothetical protein